MELDREERLGLVAHALIGPVIHIHEPRLPVRAESGGIHSVTMVLRRDVRGLSPVCDAVPSRARDRIIKLTAAEN